MPSTQPFRVRTPLPEADLLLESLSCEEGLSTLGSIRARLLSARGDIAADDLLGKPATVELALRDDATRYLHGYITEWSQGGGTSRHHGYQLVVRPWFWFLTRTRDCRIFQHKTVPEIVRAVFEDHGIASYDFKLFREYREWDYCVQYNESDFDFVSRLLEHEGIYYRFDHGDGQHRMILLDSLGAHDAQPHGADALPLIGGQAGQAPDVDHVNRWTTARAVRSGTFALKDYDFESPSKPLLTTGARPRSYDHSDLEAYEYPGGYVKAMDGTRYLDNRMDEVFSDYEVFSGSTNARSLTAGFTFSLERHPRADQNADYLVTSTLLQAHNGSLDADGRRGAPGFHCDFSALPAGQQVRPERRTPKALMKGPQTAVVTGPAGAEIETDRYGRVHVQFHWDRYGKSNEHSSCWVRVAQAWAGRNFGAIFTPRIGQEVIVDFLDGDPDRPIITGRVYNAEQMPPWDLPANATQSGILTRSSQGGSYAHANAIRFEDKKGSEQLWVHAERNHDIEVENDETHWVGQDRAKTIDRDETTHVKRNRTETVDGDETIAIHLNRRETVDIDEDIAIGGNRSISVGRSETATVALQRTHAVGVNETIAIGAAQEVAIGAAQTITVGAAQSTSVGADQRTDVGADRAITVGGAQTTSVGKARSASVSDDDSLDVGKNLVITAGDSVSITTGSASIVMRKDGTITIKGKDITVEGAGKINLKASGDIVMKGSRIQQN